jgi:hypothetical protein
MYSIYPAFVYFYNGFRVFKWFRSYFTPIKQLYFAANHMTSSCDVMAGDRYVCPTRLYPADNIACSRMGFISVKRAQSSDVTL